MCRINKQREIIALDRQGTQQQRARFTVLEIVVVVLFFYWYCYTVNAMGWGVAQLVRASDRHAADAGSIPRCGKGFFPPESTFSADSLTVPVHPPCAIACINICAHFKDPVVHVRVRWIMEMLKHPACTIGWVARLSHNWLSPGKATQIFQ